MQYTAYYRAFLVHAACIVVDIFSNLLMSYIYISIYVEINLHDKFQAL